MTPGQRCDEIIKLIDEALDGVLTTGPGGGRGEPPSTPGAVPAPWRRPAGGVVR